MSSIVLHATDLRKSFGPHTAVDGISLSVGVGERVGLLGPNGAGKTTTLLMLLGAIIADGGTIDIEGHPLPAQRSKAMEHVGFVAGYLPLPQHLTVREALRFFAGLYGVRRPDPDINAALERFGITRLADQRCESLSSGQRTLVGICKAILHRPRLVVLDEPTASLDPDVALRVRTGLKELSDDEGMALLVTSHDMLEVERLCERVIFIAAGRVVAEGQPHEVIEHYGVADLESVFLAVAGVHITEEDR